MTTVSASPGGVSYAVAGWLNSRVAVTGNYTVTNANNRATIALGGNAFYTLTFGAPSTYAANFVVMVVNEDVPPGGISTIFNLAISYAIGAQVIHYDGLEYTSLTGGNVGNNPSTDGGVHWRLGGAPTIWVSTFAYAIGAQVIGFNGHRYTSLIGANAGNDPTVTPADWTDNGAIGRGKFVSISGGQSFMLYPGQSAFVFNQNNIWEIDRERQWIIPSTTIFYVDPLGSDSNDGLAPTTGAFKTLQYAYNQIANTVNFADQNVFMQLGIGTFGPPAGSLAGAAALNIAFPWTGGGALNITGYSVLDGSLHFDSKISSSGGGSCLLLTAPCCGGIQVGLVTLLASSGSAKGITVTTANSVYLANVEFGNLGASGVGCSVSSSGGQIITNGPLYITGQATQNFSALGAGYIQFGPYTVLLGTNTAGGAGPAGSIFYNAVDGGIIEASAAVYSGNFSAGTLAASYKYNVTTNGVINHGGTSSGIPGTLTQITPAGKVDTVTAQVDGLQSVLGGLVLSTDGFFVTAIDITTGVASSDDGITLMALPTAFVKYVTVNWAQGSAGAGGGAPFTGCLDTGAIAANRAYAVFLIGQTNTNITDIIITLETAGTTPSPTMPAGWSKKRYLGTIYTDGGLGVRPFKQIGDTFTWGTPPIDINAQVLGVAAGIGNRYLLTVPLGLKTLARTRGALSNAVNGTLALIYSPEEGDPAAGAVNSNFGTNIANVAQFSQFDTITDINGRIGAVGFAANNILSFETVGWTDLARRFA